MQEPRKTEYITQSDEVARLARGGNRLEHVEGLGWRKVSAEPPSPHHHLVAGTWRRKIIHDASV